MVQFLTLLLAAALPTTLALDIPPNVKEFYNSLKAKGSCSKSLAGGFFNDEFSQGNTDYCGDHVEDYGIVYLQSPGGKFSNMDPDCDGVQGGPQDDGRCGASKTTQSRTSARSVIQSYNIGVEDLSPWEHSYVVFGNANDAVGKPGWLTFEPREVGIEMTSVMAIVCGDKMFYGVWGDENGDDSDRPSVGEVSISLATACYGKKIEASDADGSSHNEADVLYIAFTGKDAVPGATGADWKAGTFEKFHKSIEGLGNKLVSRIGGAGGSNDSTAPPPAASSSTAPVPPKASTAPPATSPTTCRWPGHCLGDSCSTANDCVDLLSCVSGKCAPKPVKGQATAAACKWQGHCQGATCKVANDCDGDLTCRSGKCTVR